MTTDIRQRGFDRMPCDMTKTKTGVDCRQLRLWWKKPLGMAPTAFLDDKEESSNQNMKIPTMKETSRPLVETQYRRERPPTTPASWFRSYQHAQKNI